MKQFDIIKKTAPVLLKCGFFLLFYSECLSFVPIQEEMHFRMLLCSTDQKCCSMNASNLNFSFGFRDGAFLRPHQTLPGGHQPRSSFPGLVPPRPDPTPPGLAHPRLWSNVM